MVYIYIYIENEPRCFQHRNSNAFRFLGVALGCDLQQLQLIVWRSETVLGWVMTVERSRGTGSH